MKYFDHICILIQLLLVFNILMFPLPYTDGDVIVVIFMLLNLNMQINLLSKEPDCSYEDLMQNLKDAERAFNVIEDAQYEVIDTLVKLEKIPKLLH
jgi:hypothetical protein